eukprot:scaffold2217_cov48-Phaeocystis_antarctica.AAC.2
MKGTIATPTVHMREHRVERAYFTLRAGFATRAAPQTHSARTREPPRTLLQRSPYRGGAPVPQADLRPPIVLRGFSPRCPQKARGVIPTRAYVLYTLRKVRTSL